MNTLYRTSQAQGDLTGAYDFRRQALESTRAYNQANTNDFYADFAYASTLMTTIDFTSTATSKAAKVAFNESMALTGARAATNPNSVEARRDLSRCLIVVGNILLFARDVASAQTSYTEALTISRALSAAAPSSMQDRVAVGLALERLAQLAGSGVIWTNVLAHWHLIKQDGQLPFFYEDNLIAYQQRVSENVPAPRIAIKR